MRGVRDRHRECLGLDQGAYVIGQPRLRLDGDLAALAPPDARQLAVDHKRMRVMRVGGRPVDLAHRPDEQPVSISTEQPQLLLGQQAYAGDRCGGPMRLLVGGQDPCCVALEIDLDELREH
jgi:hypothetical protein